MAQLGNRHLFQIIKSAANVSQQPQEVFVNTRNQTYEYGSKGLRNTFRLAAKPSKYIGTIYPDSFTDIPADALV